TWLLILGELACWLTFGLHKSDPRLIVLGTTGVAACLLMLTRICAARRQATGPAANARPTMPSTQRTRSRGTRTLLSRSRCTRTAGITRLDDVRRAERHPPLGDQNTGGGTGGGLPI